MGKGTGVGEVKRMGGGGGGEGRGERIAQGCMEVIGQAEFMEWSVYVGGSRREGEVRLG